MDSRKSIFKTMKIKQGLALIFTILIFISCEKEDPEAAYSKSQFVGEWEHYKKRTVTKERSTSAIIEDNTVILTDPYTVNLKESGFSTIDNDPLTNCEWNVRGNSLNIGCSEFYPIDDYSSGEFILTYQLTNSQTTIDNYLFYRKVK